MDNDTKLTAAEQKEKALNDWLPVTSERNAKWWYSTVHNVTAIVGAGVLGLPYAMSQLGWGPGIAIILASWLITFYTLWQLVEMHEIVPGKRFDRYHELGQHAYGEKKGFWIVAPQQYLVQIGTDIVYMVTGGKSIQKFVEIIWPQAQKLRLSYFIMIFASPHLIISHIPNFNSVSAISLAAAVMSLTYSTIAWTASAHKGVMDDVVYTSRYSTDTGKFFNFIAALGDVAFAFAGHSVVLEIQATLPSTPERPSKKLMWKGVVFAYIVVACCYFPVAFVGYYIFGNSVEDNILMSLERPPILVAIANLFVFIHVIGGYQVFAMPIFDMIEAGLVRSWNFAPSLTLRTVSRTLYVLITMFIGICFPFFGSLLSFVGGFALAPTSYYLPCFIWLKLKKPKKFGLVWTLNWLFIIVGILLTILAPIGAFRNIVLQASTYKFFS